MTEKEIVVPEYDFDIERVFTSHQDVYSKDVNGKTLASHSIYPVPTSTFLSFFNDVEQERIASLDYPTFTGITDIGERYRESDMRLKLVIFSGLEFYKLRKHPYFLYFSDSHLKDDWYSRNVYNIVEELNIQGVPVSLELEGKSQDDIYRGLLLFKKGN